MKKIILMLVLTVMSNVANAAWNSIGEFKVGERQAEQYIDPDFVRNGDVITVMSLINYHSPSQSSSVNSQVSKAEFNCSESLRRWTYAISYKGNMATGDSYNAEVISDARGAWKPVTPHTSGEAMFKIVCRR